MTTMKTITGIDSKLGRQFLVLVISGLIVSTAFAQELESASIDVFRLLMGLFGGLALFLFGIDQMSHGLKAVAGDGMASLLGGVTKNRFIGAFTGAFVTAILNSSSVTTVLVVGFITAGIMNLSQSIGVIMGANIGSTDDGADRGLQRHPVRDAADRLRFRHDFLRQDARA